MERSLTEADVDAATGDLDTADLPPATVAALRLVDCLASPHPSIEGKILMELRRHYDDGQILELAAALSVAGGWQRMIEAFGIRPDIWSEAAVLPWDRTREEAVQL
jgi:alkylhydroperoxidase family enzyme